MSAARVDVLVVGAGPVGLTASILLSRLGITHEVVEARAGLHTAPQAHVVSPRTMEILTRACGVDDSALRAVATPFGQIPVVRWVETLIGREHGNFSLVTQDRVEKMFATTPCPPANISQHRLEPVLLAAALDAGGTVRFGHKWESSTAADNEVTSTVLSHETGKRPEITSRYVLACDGASSPVRRHAGITMDGQAMVEMFTSIHLVGDLRPALGDRPGLLFWCIGGPTRAWFVVHDIERECVMMHPGDPDAPPITDAIARQLVRSAVGTDLDVEIASIAPWRMSSQVARTYRSGRTLLAGDAAHRFPPTGGIGMNTGIADVHNLCWKLADVLAGRADEQLLDTYDVERRPVATTNAEQSLHNHLKMIEVEDAVAAESGVAEAIARQEEHFDMTGLDIGFRYNSAAVIDDGIATAHDSGFNPVTDVIATAAPGHRLSHAAVTVDGEMRSSIDLARADDFVLLVAPGSSVWNGCGIPTIEVTGADETWATIRGTDDSGAILLRPDGHVAWRAATAPADPAETVHRALAAARSARRATDQFTQQPK